MKAPTSGARLATGAALLGVVFAAACEGRPRTSEAGEPGAGVRGGGAALVEFDLHRGLPEEGRASLLGPVPGRTHADFVREVRELRQGALPKGVFVRLGLASISLARAGEAGRLLGELRAKGVPVTCHADSLDKGTLVLTALGCSSVWLSPAGGADAVGVAAELLYGKRLFDTLGIQADFLQIGKYKGFEEPFKREGPSPEAKGSLENALKALQNAYIESVEAGRGKGSLGKTLEDGPYTADESKSRGLVDEVGYVDEARDAAKAKAGVTRVEAIFGGGSDDGAGRSGVTEIVRLLSGSSRTSVPHVTVLRAVGAIGMSSGGGLLPIGGGDGITERGMSRALTRLANDSSVKAVVMRLDSPGGSALASDLIWRGLMKLREKKPLVVSVGGMAASGGYYMACTGTKILAEPASILGSIGVAGGKFGVGKALESIGVTSETISASSDPAAAKRAAYQSALSTWDDATRSRMQASMQSTYDLFLKRIAEGRHVGVEAVAPSAEGRLFGGREARERGLVDQIGGLDDAITLALSLGSLASDAPVEVLGDGGGLFGLLDEEAAQGGESAASVRGSIAQQTLREGVTSVAPEIALFVNSLAPLGAGEHAVAALPFALRLH